MERFSFLPGHKSIILHIPNQIKEIQEKMENNLPNSSKGHGKGTTKSDKKFEEKSKLSNETLKSMLLKNLMKYIQEQSEMSIQDGLLNDVHIIDFRRGTNTDNFVCMCSFSCPFCSKKIKVAFKDYWQSSNICSHLKSHI